MSVFCKKKKDIIIIKCVNLVDNQLIWSDVVAFIYFGARVDVGFPFNKHREEDTGGYVLNDGILYRHFTAFEYTLF